MGFGSVNDLRLAIFGEVLTLFLTPPGVNMSCKEKQNETFHSMEPHLKVQSSVTAGGKPMASVCHHLLYDGIQWDLMGFTRWLFNIAMEAMAHL